MKYSQDLLGPIPEMGVYMYMFNDVVDDTWTQGNPRPCGSLDSLNIEGSNNIIAIENDDRPIISVNIPFCWRHFPTLGSIMSTTWMLFDLIVNMQQCNVNILSHTVTVYWWFDICGFGAIWCVVGYTLLNVLIVTFNAPVNVNGGGGGKGKGKPGDF